MVRVALVDDAEETRFLVATVLDLDGRFEVVAEAGDAVAALRCLPAADPDIVLVDMALTPGRCNGPDRDGAWLVPRLRRACPGVLIAILTGELVGETLDRAYGCGADAVFDKALLSGGLTDRLHDVVNRTPVG